MDIFEIGYYYGGGKNLEKIYDCLVAINSAPKDEQFWEYIEKSLRNSDLSMPGAGSIRQQVF